MLLIGALLIVATDALAADQQDGDYLYSIDAGNANITGYTGAGGPIVIPSILGGVYVTAAIGDHAFFQIASLTSVIIPNNVTYIGEGAFDQCVNLTSVTLGDGITIIEDHAFANCSSLTSIEFLGLTSPVIGGVNWTMGAPGTILGHAYADSNFPAPGEAFNGLIMGDFIPTAPGVPTGLIATPSNAQVVLTWTAPADDGGSAITGYNVYRSDTETGTYLLIDSPTGPAYTDSGVTNGQTYWYEVSAVNAIGAGARTAPSSSVPFTVPDAPTGLITTAGNGNVSLSWTAPAFDGGRGIDYYVIYQDSVPLTGHPTGLSTVITGLTNGQPYFYRVSAVNAAGEGLLSAEASATPATVPTAPIISSATAGNSNVTLVWSGPSTNGGAPITNYKVYRSITLGGETFLNTLGNVLTYTDTMLTNGQTYYYKVTAVNSVGEGPQSNEAFASPATVPTAPRGLRAVVGDSMVHLNWTVPSYTGPGTITYHLFRDSIPIWNGSGLNHEDSAVTNGIAYSYEVSANNSIGWGQNSTIVQATPLSDEQRPTAPKNLTATAGLGNVTLTWDAPAHSNASAISGYMISYGFSMDSLTNQITWNQLVYVLDGLTKGTTYYFKVAAQNSAGWGVNSSAKSATPFGVPSAPLGLGAIAGNGYVLLNWTAPSYIGPSPLTYRLFRDGFPIWNGTLVAYLDMPLAKNVSFSYQLAAANSIGWGPNCTAVAATPFGAPDAPWGLSATPSDASISLSWNAVNYSGPGALIYHLFRDGALVWSGAGTNHSDNGLINGQKYIYSVTASNSLGWGENSSIVSSAPQGRPTAPTGLQVVAGSNYVQLNWSAPTYAGPGTITYHLFRNSTSIYNGTEAGYNDTSVVNFVHYSYQVAAENSIGWGPNSSAIQAMPLPSGMKPTAPRGLVVVPGNRNATLTWSTPLYSNASAVSGYMISYGTAPDSMPSHITLNQLVYIVHGLDKAVTYYFSVKAQNRAGWGDSSDIGSTTPFGVPDQPTNLSALAGNASVDLSWNAPSYSGPGALTYHLFRDGILVWSGSELAYNDTGLANGQEYSYKASTSNDVGRGPNSTEVRATPFAPVAPGPPENFNVTVGNGFVDLAWDRPTLSGTSRVTGYNVYKGEDASHMTFLATVTSATSYKDSAVLNGHQYWYQVCAVSSVGEGPLTGVLSAQPHAPDVPNVIDWYTLTLSAVAGVIVIGMAISYLRSRK